MADAEELGRTMSMAASARAAFQEKMQDAKKSDEERASEGKSARQMAMDNLARGGVVSRNEVAGSKGGDSQMASAMKAFGGQLAQQQQQKVVPNWKLTGAQRAAIEEKKQMRKGGESQMASAMKAFGGIKAFEGAAASASKTSTPRTFVPTERTNIHSARSHAPVTPASERKPPPPAASASAAAATPPDVRASSGGGGGAAEAEEGVEHDLKLLVAGLKRLGVTEADGAVVAPFGKVVDDEELEQQLESLVGTLKAGRRRGVLEWEGQLLLKGKDDAVPIKLVAGKDPSAGEAPKEVEIS